MHPWIRWRRSVKRWEHRIQRACFLPAGGVVRLANRLAHQFTVRRIDLPFPRLPEALDGLTIIHLSDFHFGDTFHPRRHLELVVNACRELGADLICVTGDWVDWESEALAAALPLLKTLQPRLGWVGCLGNHDTYDNRWHVIRLLRAWLGNDLLINAAVSRQIGDDVLEIVGMDYAISRKRIQRHFKNLQTRRIVGASFTIGLSHHPNGFTLLKNAHVDLLLSGHTHGGQISLTAAPAPVVSPIAHHFPYIRGLYEENGSKLYVHNGIGHTLPLRWNCPTEVTQFRLVRARQYLDKAAAA